MSTVINNPTPAPTERTVIENSDSSGWMVAVIVLLVVIGIGAYVWMNYRGVWFSGGEQPTAPGQTNINVTIPTPDTTTNPTAPQTK